MPQGLSNREKVKTVMRFRIGGFVVNKLNSNSSVIKCQSEFKIFCCILYRKAKAKKLFRQSAWSFCLRGGAGGLCASNFWNSFFFGLIWPVE